MRSYPRSSAADEIYATPYDTPRITTRRSKDMSVTRQTVSSGYPFEETYGYARAVRIGDQVFVSGTTARPPHLDGDAYTQLAGAIETVATALKAAGAELRHVVRTV